jgi:beta-galactosidase GanA
VARHIAKIKASGFNTVTFYFDWGYHSPKQGELDFTGIRDMERAITMAGEEGLYVITRVGPYVNAELARGGFPGWLNNQRAKARTDDPEYLKAADEWLAAIDGIVARHQINDGKGPVILHQIENELSQTSPAHRRYMDHLYAVTRSHGITVPIFHNDPGRNGNWVPDGSPVAGVVHGPVDMYAFDGYPGGTCNAQGKLPAAMARPIGAITALAGQRAARPHRPIRRDSWRKLAGAGSTIGARTGSMPATRDRPGRDMADCFTARIL